MTVLGSAAKLLLVCCSVVSLASASVTHAQSAEDEAPARLQRSLNIQAQTRSRLGVLGDAFTCKDARFLSFRRSNSEAEISDQWYVASQVWADAVLLSTLMRADNPPDKWDITEARCHIDKVFTFLDRLWNYEVGGYYARANPTGLTVEHGPRFADDNSLVGLAILATLETVDDDAARQRYQHAAIRQADFLIQSGLWDTTFGGGFWWNTNRGDTREGKPAQSNALAALFFGRLFAETGNPVYREWALRTLLWLDTILWDPYHRLYAWSVSYTDLPRRTGAEVSLGEYFSYDQAIAIAAQIQANALDGDPNRLTRAITIGESIDREFWNTSVGGYNIEAGNEQVWTSYAAWTSLGHLALYDLTANAYWLDRARANADTLDKLMAEPDGGLAYRWCACVAGQVDRTRDTAAQAWAQHLQTSLSRALITPSRSRP